uniref:Fibronectin type-III domain-containing protein n=2 Tax=Anser brachyrhynchus TaxID=132585 RepID=A0A8B9C9A4_9AVES
MALQLLALNFLLVLVPLLGAQAQEDTGPKTQGVPRETEMCQKPSWDTRLRLAPDQEEYSRNEEVMLSCPKGFEPSFTHIKCSREVQSISTGKPVYREVWMGKGTGGAWTRIRSMVECVEAFQVVPGTLDASTTSIKLNWTCSLPDACERMQATCRLAGPSSPPCEAEEVTGQEMLHGQNGTFTCNHLQPFTDYSVTISVPPSTILFTWVIRTEETVPEKPERLWLDASTGTLRWQALPSCKGEILGYQLNVTTRGPQDGGFLQVERLMLSSSVTEQPLPAHGPGTSYTVAVRGLTAAGAGAALLEEFQTNSSETPDPPDVSSRLVRDISPSRGMAVLPLRPITWVPEAGSKHQLLVAATHNGTALEGACSGELQPFNASRPPDAYVAAVLNLTAPTAFVLGDGTHGHGFHNAPLRPGWDYTALLRLVRRSQQEETFTCVCYSFSVVAGQPPGSWTGIVTGVVVLLLLLLLFAGIVWFVLSRRRKAVPIKAKENN